MVARIRVRDAGGTLRTITRIRVRDAGNVLRTISRVRVRDAGNVLRTVFDGMAASASPTSVDGYQEGTASSGSVASNNTTVTVTGGTSPYTYLWERVSGNTDTTATAGTSATTAFIATVLHDDAPYNSTWRCKVTDNLGAIVYTGNVSVALTYVDLTPP